MNCIFCKKSVWDEHGDLVCPLCDHYVHMFDHYDYGGFVLKNESKALKCEDFVVDFDVISKKNCSHE